MHDLERETRRLSEALREARGAEPVVPPRALAEALVAFEEAVRARSLEPHTDGVLSALALWPRLGDTDRAIVLSKLSRIAATFEARFAEPAPSPRKGPEPLAKRPERAVVVGDPLGAPVESVRGVGPKLGETLRGRGLETVGDLLRVLPRAYEDRRRGGKVAELAPPEAGFVVGTVKAVRSMWVRRQRGLRVVLEDEDGATLTLLWFAAYNLQFEPGERLRASGAAKVFKDGLGMVHPDIERLAVGADADSEGAPASPIVPRYPEIDGVPRKRFVKLVREALALALALGADLVDPLPASLREAEGLPAYGAALVAVHTPDADADVDALRGFRAPAQSRFIFEELFALQLALARAARERGEERGIAFRGQGRLLGAMRDALPFALTGAQERALEEIASDMRGRAPMSRLLQGDVGSGKTVVALGAALHAIEDGCQAAILAPTEVLAEQHARVLGGLASRLGIPHALVTSGATGARRRAVREEVRSGVAKLVIGTQALLDDGVSFDALGLAVIDEQHRFGVLQRAAIVAKGGAATPDLLVMTATPIPRTLAMTVYGDLAVSVLDEKPPGREPIDTRLFKAAKRDAVHEAVRRALDAGAQAYVVTPLVEASEKVDLRAAIELHAELVAGPLAGLPIGILHGRLGAEDKRAALERFARGDDRALVCTTVVEVGVDVPGATVMVVEHAERFGLAQLHQLRGRVGRGGGRSHCFLVLGRDAGPDAEERLRILTETDDGFRIAEADLRLRGPGEILGTVQAGAPALVVADLLRDVELLRRARSAAFELVARDPGLREAEHARAWEALSARFGPLLELVRIG